MQPPLPEGAPPCAVIPFSGESMRPLFSPGDHLLVRFFNSAHATLPLQNGDLLLFRSGAEWVAHRLIKNQRSKGDRARFFDVDVEGDGEVDGALARPWGRVEGLRTPRRTYYWGPRGMKLKGLSARLSTRSAAQSRPLRWLYLIALALVIHLSLLRHRSPTPNVGL